MPSDPPAGFVPAAIACKALGISDRTLRRRVQAGELEGEYIARPQGSALYVRLPEEAAGHAAPRKSEKIAEENRENHAPPATRQDAALAAQLLERLDGKDTALLAATERAVRAEAERDAARQAAEQAAQTARERIADLAARLERAEAALERARRPWWRKLLDG